MKVLDQSGSSDYLNPKEEVLDMQTTFLPVTDPRCKDAIDPAADSGMAGPQKWRQAAKDLIAFWVSEKRCLSSGELSAAMREHRPDEMVFSCPSVGEWVQDLYYSGQMPNYVDYDGTSVPMVQVSRVTEGLYPDRTAAGIAVFVYGPDVQACLDHPFEVFIPDPRKGENMACAPAPAMTQTAQAAADLSGRTKSAVAIMGDRIANQALVAKVWPDGRLCIPRNAFEALVHLNGTPLRGGDPVFVVVGDTEVTVTLAPTGNPDEKSYDLWRNQGRIAVTHPVKPFVPGTVYDIAVTASALTVNTI